MMLTRNMPFLRDASGQEHALEGALTRLGRAIENEIVIASKQASREHARVKRDGRRTFLHDLGSTNGTFVNEERVLGDVQLHDGDQIRIGDVVLMFFDPDTTTRETPFPELELHLDAGEVRLNRRLVTLSPKEFSLLSFLFTRRGKVCSKDEIGRAVWAEYEVGVFNYQIENLVRRLRTKIEVDPNVPALLVTIRGLGYKLVGPLGD